mmetsp:Transcript_13841/g.18060  ORF Transcript_13841/g.18060 Transcript_13841/m.18060 type:complete len:806 (+) Transcript_13841:144-2561(+)|eukprot:CAMPEP_0198147628 /NCGR_PEP_ID=MMETSP1443-20131203/36907_1 /TAXON_ID=186043 /ORGANISM="Entomoneis sp., Strain CCMP2396" /LENGTH=805 /DNA_ID=CAMNT_0043812037 /DNA_START=141 /DNA_END=2558 /DNA_ORIENTATION=-
MGNSAYSKSCAEGEEGVRHGSIYFDANDRPELGMGSYDSIKQMMDKQLDEGETQNEEVTNEVNVSSSAPAHEDHDRKNIYSQPIQLDKEYKHPVYEKTNMQKAFLMDALKNVFLFLDKSGGEREMFINAMETELFEEGSTIIQQGDMGDFFYIVGQGTVGFVKDEKDVGSCSRGAHFGELALLYDAPRAASCVARTEVQVYKVDQRTFRLILARQQTEEDTDIRGLIRGINIFKDLDEATLYRFTRAMVPTKFKEGDRIVQKGEEGNVFYIVQTGKVKIHDIGLGDSSFRDHTLLPGDWFGERALLTGQPRAANVTAVSDAVLLAMDRHLFENTIGSLKGLIEVERRKNFLRSLPLFNQGEAPLADPELHQLVGLLEEVSYPKDHKLAVFGKPYKMALWIIKEGNLLVTNKKTGKVHHLKTGDHFGGKSIGASAEHLSSNDAICEDELTAWMLTRENIESIAGVISKIGVRKEVERLTEKIGLKDLTKHKVLGQGAFGKVWLVEQTGTGRTFALKAVTKLNIIQSKQEDCIMREKELLELLSHQFVLNLMATFQDDNYLYFLLPVISGGELFSVLHKQKVRGKGLVNNSAAFYTACVIEALGHFHQRSVAYRDLKLENVMIDGDGYCVIVDLGFAKVVEDKTFTLVGTPEYLAPELIMSRGHNKAVDYWSFGVLCYELLCGVSPFFIPHSKQISMFKRIVLGKYSVPTYCDPAAADMISRLLVRRDMERLGNLSRGHLDIKLHAWYENSGIDFTLIMEKEAKAPWQPVVNDPLDASNFDDFSNSEKDEPLERSLTPEEQEKFKNF